MQRRRRSSDGETKGWDLVSLLSIGTAAAVTAAVYQRLPDPLPTHFDLEGNADGWTPRALGAWLLPGLALLLWAAIRLGPRILPASDRARLRPSTTALVAMMTACFMAALHVVVLGAALVPTLSVTKLVFGLVGALLVGLGLVLPRVRRNPLIGVRTAFTLRDDEIWARTQRVGGYAMVIAGVVGGTAGATGGPRGAVFATGCFVMAGLVPAVHSLLLARRAEAERDRSS
mgnify:CR=1 FL=1